MSRERILRIKRILELKTCLLGLSSFISFNLVLLAQVALFHTESCWTCFSLSLSCLTCPAGGLDTLLSFLPRLWAPSFALLFSEATKQKNRQFSAAEPLRFLQFPALIFELQSPALPLKNEETFSYALEVEFLRYLERFGLTCPSKLAGSVFVRRKFKICGENPLGEPS